MTHPSSRNPSDCVPELECKICEVLGAAKNALPVGDSVIVAQTYRSLDDQQAAWKCGRDENDNIIEPWNIKTKCKPGTSEHNLTDASGNPASRAVDFLIVRHGRVVDSADDSSYVILGRIGKDQGLEWSGDWKKSFEAAHFQLPKEN